MHNKTKHVASVMRVRSCSKALFVNRGMFVNRGKICSWNVFVNRGVRKPRVFVNRGMTVFLSSLYI